MVRNQAGIWMVLVALSASTAWAYDGPKGVTLRAPVVVGKEAARHLRLGEIIVEVVVQDDVGWTKEVQGKDRAFPGGFVPTRARTRMSFSLENTSKKE